MQELRTRQTSAALNHASAGLPPFRGRSPRRRAKPKTPLDIRQPSASGPHVNDRKLRPSRNASGRWCPGLNRFRTVGGSSLRCGPATGHWSPRCRTSYIPFTEGCDCFSCELVADERMLSELLGDDGNIQAGTDWRDYMKPVRLFLLCSITSALVPVAAFAQQGSDRKAFFGETHVHTGWSFDAYIFGNHYTDAGRCLQLRHGRDDQASAGLRHQDRNAARL